MIHVSSRRSAQWVLLLSISVLGGGCATFSEDGGFAQVTDTARTRLGKEVIWSRSEADQQRIDAKVSELLARPLSVDDAVQLALLNNRELQATFADLAISEADLVQAGTVPNPRFSLLRATHGEELKIEQILAFNVLSIAAMPTARAVEENRFERTRQQVSLAVLMLAADTRKAYYAAVAAEQSVRYARQVRKAADASAELARRMVAAGNFSKLAQAREQAFLSDAELALTRAEQSTAVSRERLIVLLGLSAEMSALQLPERLPDLPEQVVELGDAEQEALDQRLDVLAARADAASLAEQLGLTKATRLINVLELGPARVLEGQRSDSYQNGFELALEVPLFDWGTARVAKAQARYMQALQRVAAAAIAARSEVRVRYQGMRAGYDLACRYRDEVVPLQKRIVGEQQRRYNGMLTSVFDLLADVRTQIQSVDSYIEALRDYWLAQANFDASLMGAGSALSTETPLMARSARGAREEQR